MLAILRTSFTRSLPALRTAAIPRAGAPVHTRMFLTASVLQAAAATATATASKTKAKTTKAKPVGRPPAKKTVKAKAKAKAAPKKKVRAKKVAKKVDKDGVKKVRKPKCMRSAPPKRAPTAYGFFLVSRKEVDVCDGHTAFGEWSKRQGELWRSMSDAEKQPFIDLGNEAAKTHAIEAQTWVDTVHPDIVSKIRRFSSKHGKRLSRATRTDGLKRPANKYMIFLQDQRKIYAEANGKLDKSNIGSMTKEWAEKYKRLSQEEMAALEHRYMQAREEYETQLGKLSA
ncbi:hypothetical protein BDQ17DRAFT_1368563 [Cyathus striatus]|nr:hypothetical protein BDQ17DRAFT_1368563 [Cyathus striatus]